ncbi:MAG TPA: hypothetical protein VFA81_10760 [Burkholderiales bacterium]|nr:hypothetical protein [Burkholderiales bacterium]
MSPNHELIETVRHICVRSGVPSTVMGAICHEIHHAPLAAEGALRLARAVLRQWTEKYAHELEEMFDRRSGKD